MTEASRQTISYLSKRLSDVGIEPNHRHGQNFLVDMNMLDFIAHQAEIGPEDVVLEVGTGTGSLTSRLASQAWRVVSVEIDPRMFQIASEELARFSNVSLLQLDALSSKHEIDSQIADEIEEYLAGGVRRLLLVANLPYHVATPLLTNLLVWKHVPQSMTVTIQKEVGERLLASPSTPAYGALSVFVQAICDGQMLRVLPPSVFWPKPKIDSAVVRIVPNPDKSKRVGDVVAFQEFVRGAFAHRRKMLRGVLSSLQHAAVNKNQLDAAFGKIGIAATARAEEVGVLQWIELFHALQPT